MCYCEGGDASQIAPLDHVVKWLSGLPAGQRSHVNALTVLPFEAAWASAGSDNGVWLYGPELCVIVSDRCPLTAVRPYLGANCAFTADLAALLTLTDGIDETVLFHESSHHVDAGWSASTEGQSAMQAAVDSDAQRPGA